MLTFVLLALVVIGIACTIPFLTKQLSKKFKFSKALQVGIEIVAIGAILFFGFILIVGNLFSAIVPDYPVIKKNIDARYYYTRQEYGWAAGSLPGWHLEFFEKRSMFWDKKLGHIQWREGNEDLTISLVTDEDQQGHLVVKSRQATLDTLISLKKPFDFIYKPSPKSSN